MSKSGKKNFYTKNKQTRATKAILKSKNHLKQNFKTASKNDIYKAKPQKRTSRENANRRNVDNFVKYRLRQDVMPTHQNRRAPGEVTFVALDTCVLIGMARAIEMRQESAIYANTFLKKKKKEKKDQKYYDTLNNMLDKNVLTAKGERKSGSGIVFCITPSVIEEITNEDGKLYPDMEFLFKSHGFIVCEIDESLKERYEKLKSKVTKEYLKYGLFTEIEKETIQTTVDKLENYDDIVKVYEEDDDEITVVKETVSQDARIVFDSSCLNLTLLSRDKHIASNFSNENRKRLLKINRNCFEKPSGIEAEPMRVEQFWKDYSQGKPFAKPKRSALLTSECHKMFEAFLKINKTPDKKPKKCTDSFKNRYTECPNEYYTYDKFEHEDYSKEF